MTRIRPAKRRYGFVDTSVVGLFRNRKEADTFMEASVIGAREEGLCVCGDAGVDSEWEVCWTIESHVVV